MQIVTVKAAVAIPRVPNFLRTEGGMMLPLTAFDDKALREIAEQWTLNLIERANEMREEAKGK